MNLDQLGASFTQNRTAILGTAAAGVVGLALYKRKQAAAAPAAPTAGATTGGVYSAGGQTAGMTGGAYDSSASDVYGLVQPQLESLGGQINDLNSKLGSVPVSQAPPVASTLLHPSYNGSYVRFADGAVDEVESDGSLYWLSPSEHATAFANAGGHWDASGLVDQLNVNSPTAGIYSTGSNILDRQPKLTPAPTPAPATS